MTTIKIDIPAISELADAIHVLASARYEAALIKQGEPPAAADEPKKETEPITITLEQVRAKLAALTQGGKQAEVKTLIEKYGGAKLSDIPKDKYPELMQEAEGI